MIRVGTCSWTEKTLLKSGEFYPKESTSAEDRLRYYATFFDTVEIDSSYYAIPDPRNASVWAERTPGDFVFHVKAFGALTGHGVEARALPAEIHRALSAGDRGKRYVYVKSPELLRTLGRRFADSLVPLKEGGKLGVVVYQFPPWFHYKSGNLDQVVFYTSLVAGLPVAVEFRHGSWLTPARAEQVFDFLRRNGIALTVADEPQYGNLATIPFAPEVTAEVAYFRFHGRNRENWLKKGVETSLRYDYLYSAEELNSFLPHLLKADRKAKVTYAMFNNCHGASAIRNARSLKQMLGNKMRREE